MHILDILYYIATVNVLKYQAIYLKEKDDDRKYLHEIKKIHFINEKFRSLNNTKLL